MHIVPGQKQVVLGVASTLGYWELGAHTKFREIRFTASKVQIAVRARTHARTHTRAHTPQTEWCSHKPTVVQYKDCELPAGNFVLTNQKNSV
jgi:hypothetical protein